MTALNPDRAIYFVLCRYRSGMDWAARDIARTCKTCTIEDIRSGELPNVQQVIELNVAEFSSRDVTEDILAEALKANFIAIGERLFADQLAFERDHERDYRKHGRAEEDARGTPARGNGGSLDGQIQESNCSVLQAALAITRHA